MKCITGDPLHVAALATMASLSLSQSHANPGGLGLGIHSTWPNTLGLWKLLSPFLLIWMRTNMTRIQFGKRNPAQNGQTLSENWRLKNKTRSSHPCPDPMVTLCKLPKGFSFHLQIMSGDMFTFNWVISRGDPPSSTSHHHEALTLDFRPLRSQACTTLMLHDFAISWAWGSSEVTWFLLCFCFSGFFCLKDKTPKSTKVFISWRVNLRFEAWLENRWFCCWIGCEDNWFDELIELDIN